MLIQRKLGEAYMGTLLCNYFKFKKKKKKKTFSKGTRVFRPINHISLKECFTTNPLTLRDIHNKFDIYCV